MMYFNITTIIGKTANIPLEEFNEEKKLTIDEIEEKKEKFLQEFKEFYSPYSSSMVIDFIVFSKEMNYCSPIVIKLKTDNYGNSFSIESNPIQLFESNIYTKYLNIATFFFIFTCILITHFTYWNIIYAFKIAYLKFDKKKGLEIQDLLIKTPYSIYDFLKAFIYCNFMDFLTMCQTISYIMNIILLVLYLQWNFLIMEDLEILSEKDKFRKVIYDFKFSHAILYLAYVMEIYRYIFAFCCLFMFMRLAENFKNIFPILSEYLIGFKKAIPDIISILTIFFLIIIGTSIVQWLYFSQKIEGSDSFWMSFVNNLFFCIGNKKELVTQMIETDSLYGFIYVLGVLYFIKYGILRIFLCIILYSFENLQVIMKNKYTPTTMEKLLNDQSNSAAIYYYMKICEMWRKFIKKKNLKRTDNYDNSIIKNEDLDNFKKLNYISIEKDKEKYFSSQKEIEMKIIYDENINQENHNYKIDFKDNKNNNFELESKIWEIYAKKNLLNQKELYENDLKFIHAEYNEERELIERDPYFDSQKDQERLEAYYLEKYQTIFIRNLSYLLMILFCIIAIIYNSLAPWDYAYRQIIENKLKYNKEQQDLYTIGKKILL
jgi:hypothetical protein